WALMNVMLVSQVTHSGSTFHSKQSIKEEMEKIFLFFLLIFHGGFSAVTRVHIHVNEGKTWKEAQSYCRQNYKDLSTISSTEENLRLRTMLGATNNHAWIGMYRNGTELDQFIWSDGDLQTNFYQWKGRQPDGKTNNQHCVEVDGTGWADFGCDNVLHSLDVVFQDIRFVSLKHSCM
uniref:C-type lectin domain-containing protein n=1 Tax=Cyprinus carpio TaxID=7962 RepID=A0A8C1R9S7_CYPCA